MSRFPVKITCCNEDKQKGFSLCKPSRLKKTLDSLNLKLNKKTPKSLPTF